MSVPLSKRGGGDSQLQVLVVARELCKYVIVITSNKKNFSSNYQTLTDKFIDCVLEIYLSLYTANNVRVTDNITYTKRLKSSYRAYLCCNDVLAYLDLLIDCFHLRSKRQSYLTRKILGLRSLIQKWRISDKERYKQYKMIPLQEEEMLGFDLTKDNNI